MALIPFGSCPGRRTRLRRTLSQSVITLLVGLLTAATLTGLQGCSTQPPDIARMVTDAKTPADHEAIAEYYEKEAAANEAQASSHSQLAQTYRQFHNTYKNEMAPHCELESDYYSKIAAQDSALAQAHRKMAQGSQ